jgi:hypothetical protein
MNTLLALDELVSAEEAVQAPKYIGGVMVKAPPFEPPSGQGVSISGNEDAWQGPPRKFYDPWANSAPDTRGEFVTETAGDTGTASSNSEASKAAAILEFDILNEFINSEPVHVQVHPKVTEFKAPPAMRDTQTSSLGKMLPAPSLIQLEVLHDAAFEKYKQIYIDAMITHFFPQLHADIQLAHRAQSKA